MDRPIIACTCTMYIWWPNAEHLPTRYTLYDIIGRPIALIVVGRPIIACTMFWWPKYPQLDGLMLNISQPDIHYNVDNYIHVDNWAGALG